MQYNDPWAATNQPTENPTDWGAMFSNPLLLKAAGELGSSLSNPGSPGDVMGKSVVGMVQASGLNKGMTAAKANQPDPATIAKQYADMAAALKKLQEINPELFPGGASLVSSAFNAPIPTIPNPTVPVAANTAEQAVTGAPPTVQPTGVPPTVDASAFNPPPAPMSPTMSDALAMSLTPEQVAGVHKFGLDVGAQDIARMGALTGVQNAQVNMRQVAVMERDQISKEVNAPYDRLGKLTTSLNNLAQAGNFASDAAYRDWERGAEGQAFKIRYAGESTRLAHELDNQRKGMDRKVLSDLITTSGLEGQKPDWLPPGIPSVGAFLKMSFEDKTGATAIVQAFNSMNDYKAAKEISSAKMAEIKQGRVDKETENDWRRLEAVDRTVMQLKGKQKRSDFPAGLDGDAAYKTAQILGTAMSANDESKLKELDVQRRILNQRLKIPHTDIPVTTGGSRITVTPEELSEIQRGMRIDINKMFNPQATPLPGLNPASLFNTGGL